MREIAPNIFLVPGENKSLFPFCTCLYLKGKDLRVLIDAGMGKARMAACKEKGVDLLILTHCHYDHRSTIKHLPGVPVWCHAAEAAHLRDTESYLKGTGLIRSGMDTEQLFKGFAFPDFRFERNLAGGEKIDLGGLTLEVIHTPGHTPGHLSFFVPEADFLFSGDVALNGFGPFYGNDFSSIDDFLESIRKLKDLNASTVATSHSGPFRDKLPERFARFEATIHRRDELVLKAFEKPRPLADLLGKHLFFKDYPEPREIMIWMERVKIEKHLERLTRMGRIREEGTRYVKEKP